MNTNGKHARKVGKHAKTDGTAVRWTVAERIALAAVIAPEVNDIIKTVGDIILALLP